jgi:hypothetical protein
VQNPLAQKNMINRKFSFDELGSVLKLTRKSISTQREILKDQQKRIITQRNKFEIYINEEPTKPPRRKNAIFFSHDIFCL